MFVGHFQRQTLPLALSVMAYAAVQDIVEVALSCRCTHNVISIHGSSFHSKIQYLINARLKDLQLHHQNSSMVHKKYECLANIQCTLSC